MEKDLSIKAEGFFRSGFNCAEAVLLAAAETHNLGLGQSDVRIATGLGGGMGRGEVCGALSGAVLALGAAVGRTDPSQDQGSFKELREQVVSQFEKELGTLSCRELKTEDREDCVAIVRTAAAALATVLAQQSR